MKLVFCFLGALLCQPLPAAEPPHILIREALQFENIGDSGRVPGTIRLLYQHLPEATVTLWPWHLHEREREMLMRAFPKLRIAEGASVAPWWEALPGKARAYFRRYCEADDPARFVALVTGATCCCPVAYLKTVVAGPGTERH